MEGGDSDPTDEQKCFSASGQPTSCDDKQVKKPEIQGIPTPVSPANEDEPSYDNGSKPSNPEDDSGSKNGENSDDEQPPRSEDKPDQPSGDSDDD